MIENLINEQIQDKASKVLLINEDGEKVGIMPTKIALYKASDAGLDLVCINISSDPVVCKIMDYSKYKYQTMKREKENKAKQHETETKEIQLRPQIDKHDIETKVKKCREELSKGNKIKLVITFKGRQLDHAELGFNVLTKFKESLIDVADVAKDGKLEGRRIECILNPKK